MSLVVADTEPEADASPDRQPIETHFPTWIIWLIVVAWVVALIPILRAIVIGLH